MSRSSVIGREWPSLSRTVLVLRQNPKVGFDAATAWPPGAVVASAAEPATPASHSRRDGSADMLVPCLNTRCCEEMLAEEGGLRHETRAKTERYAWPRRILP